ncbi:MAG TPA: TolC family protein, partial [Porphyromonadaceae bacterium]|nr:TolC family protein [Porphyromonadaceae bacterium]HBL33780.1 TolC family protein [Porphyromonadaceae bacterium]HBX45631.1 TolC family protein [Porphyromonadaceae bacterium]
MKARCFIALLAVWATIASLPAQRPFTLEECIEVALRNNRTVKQQQLSKEQQQIAYSQARADLLPNLNASVGHNFVFGRSKGRDDVYQSNNSSQTNFSISSDLTLFDGLRMKYNIDARKADLQASEADLQKIERDITLSVSTAFLQVLLNKELLQIAAEQVEVTKANIERSKQMVNNGKMAQGELYELEAQQAQEELEQVRAESNLQLALLDLAQIMELEEFSQFDVTAPAVETLINEGVLLSSDAVYQSAIMHRPEIHGAQYRLVSSEKEWLMAKSQYYPSLSFGANMGTGYYHMNGLENDSFSSQFRNNMSNSIGFSLSIPLFNRFQIRNSVRNARLAIENSKLEMDKTKLDLRKQVEQAYYNALGAKSRWKAAQKSEKATEEAFRFAEQKYENGRATSYELFQAKNNRTKVLGEQAQAKYEYAFRLKI